MDSFAMPGGRSAGEHIRRAHETLRGDHQLAEYVAGLGIEDCVRALAQAPAELPVLAALRDACRVGRTRGVASRR